MKRIKILILILLVLFSSIVFAANPSKEINNKCRQNLKILNEATAKMLAQKEDYRFQAWTSYKQAISSFLEPDKYLDGKKIEGPTPDCEYYLVSMNKDEHQWLCNLHGVIDGDSIISLKYHEYQLQGKTNKKYMTNENYAKHVKEMLRWTEYTLTPKEFIKYHYNMNPIVTTVATIFLIVVSYLLLKSFFKF